VQFEFNITQIFQGVAGGGIDPGKYSGSTDMVLKLDSRLPTRRSPHDGICDASKLYPLSQAANPPTTKFVDAIDVVFDGVIPYDVRFFQSLDRMVQSEQWLDRDGVMIDMLKSIGIEKGKPSSPM
jgi:hypothetical protein